MRIYKKSPCFRGGGLSRGFRGPQKTHFYCERLQSPEGGVVRPNFVLDIALAMPAAILTFRQSGENFARSRDKSNFPRSP